MVRYLWYRVCHYSVGDPDVSGPQLVKIVTLLVGRRSFPQSWGEAGLNQSGVHFPELPVEVPT